jgi:two-component system, OmpR family, phosphate regulon response regulator PhoB
MTATGIKILVIEDEPDVRIYIANLLRSHGYEPIWAGTADQSLASARTEQPALIVLDAMLPDDQAQTIYAALKNDPRLCCIPVVLLASITRRALDGARLYATGSGKKRLPEPEAFLSKPPEAEDFLAVINRLASPAFDTQRKGGS